MSVTPTRRSPLATQKAIAQATYEESVRVTEAYQIQLRKRKEAQCSNEAEKVRRIEEALGQMEAAERREYEAWLQLEHLRQMAIKKPWATQYADVWDRQP